MKIRILQIVLLLGIAYLGYLLWETIQTPVRFNREKDERAALVVQNLKDIRSVQQMYRSLNDTFANNLDSLIKFMHQGQIPVVKLTYDPTDTTLTKTISDTLGYISVADSLFGRRPNFKVENLKYIPFSDKEKFTMEAGRINKGGVMVPVFMAMARKEDYLDGLDKNLIRNPSVKDLIVGSMSEPTIDGNWE
ncbi:MAG: hypothetical protein RBR47_10800 [Bacteroidales bacterium]|jgi:hypothetical protein|nr:hypothetical protein [Bacteroidales bacterium]NCU36341.1 hypothetical protein [Candidatus Falkowbacteria bacterium]MDD2632861.1 hypothetical protein [Bacteroidales bacterium]MDD3131430.1 hypothetical protein [Bacteroidales bacterium]MDD3527139.1 hypothetical protein [Bacteroidales bacterium]